MLNSYIPLYYIRKPKHYSNEAFELNVPEGCLKIIQLLNSSGYEAYVVGGCIRDSILNLQPHDWDIATSATPEEMKKVLRDYRHYDTGIEHGTVTFIVGESNYEVTTFRKESNYLDGRHPSCVEFVSTIEQDLSRRDFTMNAIAWNPYKGYIDPYNGIVDIKNNIIKCVGNSKERFIEDHLRILRALRFSATLNFNIHFETQEAINTKYYLLNSISAERIASEIWKMFSTKYTYRLCSILDDNPYVISEAFRCYQLAYMLNYDQHSKYHDRDLWNHSVDVMSLVPAIPELRIAALFHDIGKPDVRTADEDGYWHYLRHPERSETIVRNSLKKLKCSNETIEHICFLVLNHDLRPTSTKRSARKFIIRCHEDENLMNELLELMRADIACHTRESALIMRSQLDEAIKVIEEELNEANCFKLKDLSVNGNDLINLGFEQGPEIGYCLNQLLELVISDEIENDHAKLIEAAKNILSNKNI